MTNLENTSSPDQPGMPPTDVGAREIALRDILEAISANRGDELPVLKAIVQNAARLCDAKLAGLSLVNEARTLLHYACIWGEDRGVFKTGHEFDLNSPLQVATTIREARIIHTPDLSDDPLYIARDPTRVKIVEEVGVRTFLTVPLVRNGVAFGCLNLNRFEVKPFSDTDIALIETFAEQAVIAIENVRQFREVQTRLEREEATREVLGVLSRSRDNETPVFELVLRKSSLLCNADTCALMLGDPDGDELRLAMFHAGDRVQPPDEIAELERLKTTVLAMDEELHLSAQAICSGDIVHVEDLSLHPGYLAGKATFKAMVEQQGERTVLSVPLIDKNGAIGAINLHRKHVERFTEDEIELVRGFAEQAVNAIQNVRQFREVQERLEREEATREVLEVISSSRTDTAPVFEVILRNAARLCDASMADLDLVDDDGVHLREVSTFGPTKRSVPSDHWVWRMDSDYSHVVAILKGAVAHVPDMTKTEKYLSGDPMTLAAVDEEKVRTGLVVPLMNGGRGIGCLVLFRQVQKPFSPDEIALVETFAAQAVIAIENARQFSELQTRLEREAATREVLEVISNSRTDPAPVFNVILRNAAQLAGAPLANLCLLNTERSHWHLVAHFGDGLRHLAIGETKTPLDSELVPAAAIRTARVVQVEDLTDTDLYRHGDPGRVAMVDVEGMRTIVCVPLLIGAQAIGCITLFRREIESFTNDEISLVETFAAQAVIAIENVRQFREVQERLEREQASAEILEVISQSRDNEAPVFKLIQDHASRLCNAPFSGLFMVDSTGENLNIVSHTGSEPAYVGDGKSIWPLSGRSVMARAVVKKRAIKIDKMSETPAFLDGDPTTIRAVELEKISSFLAVPLLSDGQAIGCIGLYRTEPEPFTEDQMELVSTFAAQAVIAIDNVKQFNALEQLNAELGDRVQEQVGEIERMGRLKRFLSPQVADAVVSSGDDNLLGSHRALIAILFCDIRGFTAFCESAEPEETIEVLQTFHETLGKLIHEAGAGFDHRSGDGIMVVFNDPVPCDDPAGAALRVAVQMRQSMVEICTKWRKLGHRMGFGVGISLGYATVGMVGFEGRYDYTASGTAVNLASRLCDQATDQEILLSQRAATALESIANIESAGELTLKGFHAPVDVFKVTEMKEIQ